MIDDDLKDLVVEIPEDTLALGHDPDGLPRTEPGKKDLPKNADGTPDISHKEKEPTAAELAAKKAEEEAGKGWREERTRLQRERDARAQEAEQAKAAAAAERKAREEAQTEALKSTGVAMQAHMTTLQTRKEQFEAGLTNTKSHIEAIKADIRRASAEGDHDKLADLQEALAEAKVNQGTYEQAQRAIAAEIEHAQSAFEKAPREVPKDREPDPARQQPQTFDFDDFISKSPGATQPWLKKHRADLQDPKLLQRVVKYAQGYALQRDDPDALNTQEFVEELEDKFFPKAEEDPDTVTEQVEEKPVEKKAPKATPAAPVGRSSGYFSSRNLDASKIRMPSDLVEFCKRAGLDPTQYALGVREDIRAGKLPKEWLDPGYDRGI